MGRRESFCTEGTGKDALTEWIKSKEEPYWNLLPERIELYETPGTHVASQITTRFGKLQSYTHGNEKVKLDDAELKLFRYELRSLLPAILEPHSVSWVKCALAVLILSWHGELEANDLDFWWSPLHESENDVSLKTLFAILYLPRKAKKTKKKFEQL